jgi:hypothetical protein
LVRAGVGVIIRVRLRVRDKVGVGLRGGGGRFGIMGAGVRVRLGAISEGRSPPRLLYTYQGYSILTKATLYSLRAPPRPTTHRCADGNGALRQAAAAGW